MVMAPAVKVPARFNFTKTALAAIAPPATGRTYAYDTHTPGLAICTTATGRKTFYSYRKVHGRPERIRIGRWPEMTVEQARDEAAKINGTVAAGENPNDKRRLNRKSPTLGEVYQEFLEAPTRTRAKRAKSPATVAGYEQQWRACLAPWEDRKLASLSRHEIERLHNDLGTTSGHYSANRVLALVKALFNHAIDQGYFASNPAVRLRPFEERSRDRFLQADELPRFWKAVDAEPSEKIRDFVRLSLFTGQRRSNVLSMRWDDVNLERAVWSIPRQKGGKPHEVPLPQPALEILRRRLVGRATSGPANPDDPDKRLPSEFVFPGLHGEGHLKEPMRQWRSILENAGIDNLRIHDLRRSLGSWQTITGTNEKTVGRTLGHTDPAATAVYARVDLTAVRQSMETATAAILAATKPKKSGRTRRTKRGQNGTGK